MTKAECLQDILKTHPGYWLGNVPKTSFGIIPWCFIESIFQILLEHQIYDFPDIPQILSCMLNQN